jgi:hypothetical protein
MNRTSAVMVEGYRSRLCQCNNSMRIDFLIGTPHLQGGTRCLQLVQALGQLDFGPPRIRQECQRKT